MLVLEAPLIVDAKLNEELLHGGLIESAAAGSPTEAYSLDISGWALGRRCPVEAVELTYAGRVFESIPVVASRPDILLAYPGVPGAERCGFNGSVSVPGVTTELEVLVQAVLQDRRRCSLGVIRAQRSWQDFLNTRPGPK